MAKRHVLSMFDNKEITIINSRDLRIIPFRAPNNRLSCGIAWKKWLENTERQFRFFRIESPQDKKDAILIYGGRELTYLENTLPETNSKLDVYEALKKKLNDHFVPKRSKYYKRYLFNKMRQYNGETIRSYVVRLREKANDCAFNGNYEERILEHLIQTVNNKALIRKCLFKEWTLPQFLVKAYDYEETKVQIRQMMNHSTTGQDDGYRKHQQQNRRNHGSSRCSYCGLSGVHKKGYNCPAFGKQCYICRKRDHFARVCHAPRYKNTHVYPSEMREPEGQKHPSIDKNINPEGDYTKLYDRREICMELRNVCVEKVNEIKANEYTTCEPDISEEIQESRLVAQRERNREYERENELHRKCTRFRISDENEQIQQLQTEVKRLNEQCSRRWHS